MAGTKRLTGWIGLLVAILMPAVCIGAGIVINEVAWSGTAAGSSDEWIELHNSTDEVIDLVGWILTFGDTTVHLGAAEGDTLEVRRTTVPAGGYFLLERTDDETISDIEADALFKGTLSNGGLAVELRNAAGEVVDRVEPTEQGWPAGTAADGEPPYASMERSDASKDAAVWSSNDGRIRNGLDANGDPLNGTPGEENGARVIARAAPRVELISPIEEAAILSGVVVIEWSAADPDGSAEGLRISLELSFDGGVTWEGLVENLANGGSYAWNTTLHADSDNVRVGVVAEDADGYRGEADSPPLTIRNGSS